ncbi:alpha/beta hydrolase [Arthrobacter sp. NPDC089319]|uniref:alpha/beta fold hydrolase n=1 Tax=Arthrobacter sp. NPDC089319 TaxID=3155915 RepID=UPI0034246404
MKTAELQYADIAGTKICFRDSGQGRPVLFLHGTSASLGVWDGVMAGLGEGYRTIAVDQRGHGRSSKPERGYSQRDFARDILGLAAHLGLEDVVLVGHSLGARNAIVAAAMEPKRIAGVIAVDYLPFVEPEVIDNLEHRVLGGHREFNGFDEIVDYLAERYPRTPRKALEARALYGYEKRGKHYLPLAEPEAMRGTVDSFRTDFREAFTEVRGPVVVVRGEKSAIVSERAFLLAKELRPDFDYVTVPDCDHYIPEAAPEVVLEALLANFPPNER